VSETARRPTTRVTYQNSRPSPPSTYFPSPSAEREKFAANLQAARTGPPVPRQTIKNNPNLRMTAKAAVKYETESARMAREERETRERNAESAGAASRAAANAAEVLRRSIPAAARLTEAEQAAAAATQVRRENIKSVAKLRQTARAKANQGPVVGNGLLSAAPVTFSLQQQQGGRRTLRRQNNKSKHRKTQRR
jgi:hypothetical protein